MPFVSATEALGVYTDLDSNGLKPLARRIRNPDTIPISKLYFSHPDAMSKFTNEELDSFFGSEFYTSLKPFQEDTTFGHRITAGDDIVRIMVGVIRNPDHWAKYAKIEMSSRGAGLISLNWSYGNIVKWAIEAFGSDVDLFPKEAWASSFVEYSGDDFRNREFISDALRLIRKMPSESVSVTSLRRYHEELESEYMLLSWLFCHKDNIAIKSNTKRALDILHTEGGDSAEALAWGALITSLPINDVYTPKAISLIGKHSLSEVIRLRRMGVDNAKEIAAIIENDIDDETVRKVVSSNGLPRKYNVEPA